MSRQYIGARYVPRFSTLNGGVWDNQYSYEALEIVKHENNYYTSKKPVPVGIAIDNTEYWVLTGNYSGAIENLEEKIDADRIRLTNLENRVTANENNITILASTLNIVGTDIEAINNDAINFTRMITGIN
jgi:hypothetical protein